MRISEKALEVKKHYPKSELSDFIQTLLKNRNIEDHEIDGFFDTGDYDFETESGIYGINKAAEEILKAVKSKKKIVIHGDYDVDGVCATAIIWDYLYNHQRADVWPIIPNRADDGYGLSDNTIQKAIDNGAELIISVDCGIRDVELVEKYKEKLDFIITDHHQFRTDEKGKILLPASLAVVHAMHPKSKYSTPISGANTAWQLVRAIDRIADTKMNTDEYLDLVSISTICDVIHLSPENRKLVRKGFESIRNSRRVGLLELMNTAAVKKEDISSYHVGFIIGPRLNAPGRVKNDAMDSLRLLLTQNQAKAKLLANEINELNTLRQNLVKEYLEFAEKMIDHDKVIIIMGEEWPEGILGLIAGRLSEKYFLPVFVGSKNKNGEIVGSARSPVLSVELHKVLESSSEFLTRYGGHSQAAGFATNIDLFEKFKHRMTEVIEDIIIEKPVKEFECEFEVRNIVEISIDDIEQIKLFEPFGNGNPEPVFFFPECEILDFKKFGSTSSHTSLKLKIGEGMIEAKKFNDEEVYTLGGKLSILGNLKINDWGGVKRMELIVREMD